MGPRDRLIQAIIDRTDYEPADAATIADEALTADADVREAITAWVRTGEFPESPDLGGLSPRGLADRDVPLVRILTGMQSLRDDPIGARRFLFQRPGRR